MKRESSGRLQLRSPTYFVYIYIYNCCHASNASLFEWIEHSVAVIMTFITSLRFATTASSLLLSLSLSLSIYIYIYIYICVCVVPSISFQTFFVPAFKIVVDSWKFTMLLLYILWDDWPIFMISGSNEQLQQQLDYTLLKPDCHSWGISKMQTGREDTLEEWYAIKFCFQLGKNTTETYGVLQIAFGASCINRAWVFEWHMRFKEDRKSVRDDERCGRSKEVNTPELIGQTLRVWVTMLRF